MPDTGDGEPVVSLQPAAMPPSSAAMFKVSTSPPLGADGFRIGGKRYENGPVAAQPGHARVSRAGGLSQASRRGRRR